MSLRRPSLTRMRHIALSAVFLVQNWLELEANVVWGHVELRTSIRRHAHGRRSRDEASPNREHRPACGEGTQDRPTRPYTHPVGLLPSLPAGSGEGKGGDHILIG